MRNMFKKKITPSCEYCAVGILTNNKILCVKYGVTSSKNNCKKFKYDPLKRIPKKQQGIINFSEKDFKI